MKKILILTIYILTFNLSDIVYAQITYSNAVNSQNGNPVEMVISPDNKFAYCIISNYVIQTYKRNIATGQLTFLASLSHMQDGSELYNIGSMVMSPDGKYLYTSGDYKLFVFCRDSLTGLLVPFQTLSTAYSFGMLPTTSNNLVASKDGKNIYVTWRNNLATFKRDSISQMLSLIDSQENLNEVLGLNFEVSVLLSSNDSLAFITGGNGISVYSREYFSGRLIFKNRITADNFNNQELSYASQSVITSDDRFLYTVTVYGGAGALVVLSRDTVTDSLSIIQTFHNGLRPRYINISSDNKLVFINGYLGQGSISFYTADILTGTLNFFSNYNDSYRYHEKKCIDKKNRYLYTCPAFTDSIYIHQFKLFLDTIINVCAGDSVILNPWGNYASYLWSTGSTNSFITVRNGGQYYLTVQDDDGNSYTDSVLVNVLPLPVVFLGNDTTLSLNQLIYLSPGNNYTSYTWNINNDTLSYLYLTNNLDYFGINEIVVTVTDILGCSNKDTIMVMFSPQMKLNPINFYIYPNPFSSQTFLQADKAFENADLKIFNSSGHLVKQFLNISGQNLTLFRNNLPSGLYYLQLIQDNQTYATDKFIIIDK